MNYRHRGLIFVLFFLTAIQIGCAPVKFYKESSLASISPNGEIDPGVASPGDESLGNVPPGNTAPDNGSPGAPGSPGTSQPGSPASTPLPSPAATPVASPAPPSSTDMPSGTPVPTSSPMPSPMPTPMPTPAQTGPDSPTNTTAAIRSLKPVVAVRGIACLMCHADIRSNIITDFGLGTPWFMGGKEAWDNSSDPNMVSHSWFNNFINSWQTAQVIGSVIVPDAPASPNALAILGQPVPATTTIKDFLQMPYIPKLTQDGIYSARETVIGVHPASPGDERVVAKETIVIRAPLESEIREISPAFFAGSVGFKGIGQIPVQGLKVMDIGHGPFVTNDSAIPLRCRDSDILINGSLLLRNLEIDAEGGCRIYATGTVFIEGPIRYGSGMKENLQITSAHAIAMGLSKEKLDFRLNFSLAHQTLQLAEVDFAMLVAKVSAEAGLVGPLADAESFTPRASVDFTGLLLNAPIIHSRYLGRLKGTIVAEAALFALGQFHFEFDPVFESVTVFPLLNRSILTAQ